MYLMNPVALPPMPEHPTKEDAKRALALLEDLLRNFPFVDPKTEDFKSESKEMTASYAVGLSALLTPVARSAIEVSPHHIARAPVARTGKSYLFDIASAIANGTTCPVIAAGRDEEETEKRLASRIIAGNSIIGIDNVNGVLSGDLLCQVATQAIIAPRILGKSKAPEVTNRCTLFANGNNIRVHADLTERCLIGTMDAKMENPGQRNFPHKPVAMVLANRGKYIAACLTILRAYALAGYPGAKDLTPFNGFEDWSKVVRGALVWLGKADPVATIKVARAEDPQRMERIAFLEALAGVFGYGKENAATIDAMRIKANAYLDPKTWPVEHAARAALASILADYTTKHGVIDRRFGNTFLGGMKEVPLEGKQLNNCPAGGHKQKWYVETLKAKVG